MPSIIKCKLYFFVLDSNTLSCLATWQICLQLGLEQQMCAKFSEDVIRGLGGVWQNMVFRKLKGRIYFTHKHKCEIHTCLSSRFSHGFRKENTHFLLTILPPCGRYPQYLVHIPFHKMYEFICNVVLENVLERPPKNMHTNFQPPIIQIFSVVTPPIGAILQ